MKTCWSVGVALGFAMGSCSQPEPPKAPEGTASKYRTSEERSERLEAPSEDETKSGVPRPSSSADYTFGFQNRDHQLWFHAGTDPQLYSVRDTDGGVLADGIDDERLKRDYRALHEIVHGGVDFIGIGD